MLVTGSEILVPAREGKYGVGSFNTNNMEITQAIIGTAEKLRSPVMVQISEGALKYGGKDLVNITIDLATRATVPVAITSTTAAATRAPSRPSGWASRA
jgi:fructose-bisphosphate aldolase class II